MPSTTLVANSNGICAPAVAAAKVEAGVAAKVEAGFAAKVEAGVAAGVPIAFFN